MSKRMNKRKKDELTPEQEFGQYLKQAEGGNDEEENLFGLGFCYLQGYGTKQDLQKAEYWLKKAADNGGVTCQFFLSVLYRDGNESFEVNEAEFLKYCRMAAENGYPTAMYNLAGWHYEHEEYDEAEKLLIIPASNGIADAQFNLGVLYFNRSCQKGKEPTLLDMARACFWLSEAVDNDECTEKSMAERALADAKVFYRKLIVEVGCEDVSDEMAEAALTAFFEENSGVDSDKHFAIMTDRAAAMACVLIRDGYARGFGCMADLIEESNYDVDNRDHEIEMLRATANELYVEE